MRYVVIVTLLAVSTASVAAQTTAFTYQGSLVNAGEPANGNYDFEFALFDAVSSGTQAGSTITQNNVAVTNGSFAVTLDFGGQFPGADRFLELRVRQAGQPGFTTLSPRSQIRSAPYSIKSVSAENAATAGNATQLGGVAANQYVLTGDTRLSDARDPLPGSVNYVQNGTGLQSASNFNISGNGMAGGELSANTIAAASHFDIGGSRVLFNSGTNNIFAGVGAGGANTGSGNSFFGRSAGAVNSTAEFGSYFGYNAGNNNLTGSHNAFYGAFSGNANTTGASNTFFGTSSGFQNTTGFGNTFVGLSAGSLNNTGNNNTALGLGSNVASNSLTNATVIGALAQVAQSDSLVLGSINGVNGATADTKVGIGTTTPFERLHVVGNSKVEGILNVGDANGRINISRLEAQVGANSNQIVFDTAGSPDYAMGTLPTDPGNFGIHNYGTNSSALTILKSSGNIGIGTTSPTERLHVVGNGIFTGNLTVNGTVNLPSFAGQFIQNSTNQQPSSNFNITGNGIVGGSLSVGNASTSARVYLNRASSSLSDSADINFFSGGVADFSMGMSQGSAAATDFSIYNYGTASNAFTIQRSTGNIGMGAVTPTEPLVISRNFGSSTALTVENTSSGSSKKLFLLNYGISGSGNYWPGLDSANTSSLFAPNPLVLRSTSGLILSGSSTAEHMRITSSGNVGIGTTSPSVRLDLVNNDPSSYGSVIRGTGAGLLLLTTGSAFAVRSPSFPFDDQFRIGTNGNTGIGVGADSSYRLSVAGSSRLGGTVDVSGKATFNGEVKVTNLPGGGAPLICLDLINAILNLCGSSRRFKDNIADFSPGLDLVKRLRPVTFDWRKDGVHDLGLVAEEVEEVNPLLATYREGIIQGVKYDRIGVVLINAVKEQQAQIEEQRNLIEDQRNTIRSLIKTVCKIDAAAEICHQPEGTK